MSNGRASIVKFFASIHFAVILIAAITVISILATIFPEANAYQSWTFLGLVGLFTLNLTLCTIKIIPRFFRMLTKNAKDISGNKEQYQQYCFESTDALQEIEKFCRENRYKVSKFEDDTQMKILAKRAVASLFAPHLLHIAILIIILGAAITTGSVSGGVMAYVGQTSPLPSSVIQAQGYSDAKLEVVNFVTEYDQYAHVDNWITVFNLYIDGEKVVNEGMTRVNVPYQYDNMVIYQNSFGKQYLVDVQGSPKADENSAYSMPEGLPLEVDGKDVLIQEVGNEHLHILVLDEEEVLGSYEPEIGQKIVITDNASLEYLGINEYTVLQVKTNPGTNIVFLGFILATLASFLFCCGRYREMRIIVDPSANCAYISSYCKSPVIAQKMEQKLQDGLLKGE